MSGSQYEAEQDWLAEKAMLLDVHDIVVDIIQLYRLELLVILEQYEKAALYVELPGRPSAHRGNRFAYNQDELKKYWGLKQWT